MRVMLIYNENNKNEKAIIDELKNKLDIPAEITYFDFNAVRNIIAVRTTPALFFVRDDLQGDTLLGTTPVLNIEAEILRNADEEQLNMYQQKGTRFERFIVEEINRRTLIRPEVR